jgi:hypothetical protein
MSRAVYAPVVREHPSKTHGRVGSPQRTLDSGVAVADSPQIQNLTPRPEDAKGEVAATAVLCRFGISPRIQENERESKKTRCKGIRSFQLSAFRFPFYLPLHSRGFASFAGCESLLSAWLKN